MVRSVSIATKKPIMSEPASPAKIFAGGKLSTRNPSNVPMNINASPPMKTWPLMIVKATERLNEQASKIIANIVSVSILIAPVNVLLF